MTKGTAKVNNIVDMIGLDAQLKIRIYNAFEWSFLNDK